MSLASASLKHATRSPFRIVVLFRESHALSRITAHVRRLTIDLTPSLEDVSFFTINKYRVQKSALSNLVDILTQRNVV